MALSVDGSNIANVSSGTSYTISVTTANANDLLYLVVLSPPAAPTITDTAGLTWTARSGSPYGGGSDTVYIFTAPKPAAGTTTITINPGTAISYSTAIIFGIAGCNTSSPFDPDISTPISGRNAQGDIIFTTANANDIILIITVPDAGSETAASGFTIIQSADFLTVQYEIVSSTLNSQTITTTINQGNILGDAVVASLAASPLFVYKQFEPPDFRVTHVST